MIIILLFFNKHRRVKRGEIDRFIILPPGKFISRRFIESYSNYIWRTVLVGMYSPSKRADPSVSKNDECHEEALDYNRIIYNKIKNI